jgi:hypothetical protein
LGTTPIEGACTPPCVMRLLLAVTAVALTLLLTLVTSTCATPARTVASLPAGSSKVSLAPFARALANDGSGDLPGCSVEDVKKALEPQGINACRVCGLDCPLECCFFPLGAAQNIVCSIQTKTCVRFLGTSESGQVLVLNSHEPDRGATCNPVPLTSKNICAAGYDLDGLQLNCSKITVPSFETSFTPTGKCNKTSAGDGQVTSASANSPPAAPGPGADGSNTISTESASDEDAKTKSSSNAGAIAGGITGAGVVIAALGALVAWVLLFRKKRKASEESEVGLTPALEPPPSDYSLYNPPLGPPSPFAVQNYHTAPAPMAPHPVQDVSQPVQDASQPVQDASQPLQNAPQPLQNAPQPLQYSPLRAADGDALPALDSAEPLVYSAGKASSTGPQGFLGHPNLPPTEALRRILNGDAPSVDFSVSADWSDKSARLAPHQTQRGCQRTAVAVVSSSERSMNPCTAK